MQKCIRYRARVDGVDADPCISVLKGELSTGSDWFYMYRKAFDSTWRVSESTAPLLAA